MKNIYKLWTNVACLGLMVVAFNGCTPEEPAPEPSAGPNTGAPAAPKGASITIAPKTDDAAKKDEMKGEATKDEVKKDEPAKDAPKTDDKKDDAVKAPEKKDETPK